MGFAFLLSGMLFGLVMFPTMTVVWLGRNAGNANFLYNMTLVINVFGGLLLTEWIKAGMQLRRRQHIRAFCREVILTVVGQVLEGQSNAGPSTSEPEVAQLETAAVAATSDTGLRQRR